MKIIGITNRHLCRNDFFSQIEYICEKKNLYALILREKDLDDKTYAEYVIKCNDICKKYKVLFFINTNIDIAKKLNIKNIQLSFTDFMKNKDNLNEFDNIGISVHSLEEAKIAEDDFRKLEDWKKRTIFLIVGHIFKTESKKGLQPRGTDFLKNICNNVSLPIFAIGGINDNTIKQLAGINISGICMMSAMMQKQR